MDHARATARLLDAADELFYGYGIQAVGMATVRDESGVALKRLYQCYPSKDMLVEAYLKRRDERWREELREFVVSRADDATERILAVFDSLELWFEQPQFRGCAFINAFGELGATSAAVADLARQHKAALLAFLGELVADTGIEAPEDLAHQLLMLVDGSIVAAALNRDPLSARRARAAAATLLAAELARSTASTSSRVSGPRRPATRRSGR